MHERLGPATARILPVAIAVVLPLAGVVLCLAAFQQQRRTDTLRFLAATVLGVCLYALFVF